MTSFAAGASDPGFAVPLRRARAFGLLRAGIVAVLWSIAATLLAMKIGGLLAPTTDRLVIGAAIFVAALAIGLFTVIRAAPNLLQLARRADARFGLGERLSAALALPTDPKGWQATLQTGLRRDADEHARAIVPHRLEPVVDWSVAVAAIVVAAAIAACWLLPTPVAAPPVAPFQVAATSVDPAARAQNLKSIADTISADAKARQSDYLEAVAATINKLAEPSNAGLSDADYNKALTGLLDHARLAYGKARPGWLRGDAASPADPFHLAQDGDFSTLAKSAQGQADDGRAGGGEEMVPELLSEQGLLPNVPAPLPAAGRIKLAPDSGDMAVSNQNVGGNTDTANSATGRSSPAAGGAPPALGETKPTALGDITGAAGIPLGAATQSGAGASRVAGAGTQAVDDPGRVAAAPIAADDQVMLPADQYRQGKRIRIEVMPQAANGDAGGGPGVPMSSDNRQMPVARGIPSVRDQAVFARYFTHGEAS